MIVQACARGAPAVYRRSANGLPHQTAENKKSSTSCPLVWRLLTAKIHDALQLNADQIEYLREEKALSDG
jgi:hypothetical protein